MELSGLVWNVTNRPHCSASWCGFKIKYCWKFTLSSLAPDLCHEILSKYNNCEEGRLFDGCTEPVGFWRWKMLCEL